MVAVASSAWAQTPTSSVGYPPTSSPFVDLEHTQELTFLAGQYHAHRDPAHVGPQPGLALGVRYAWRATGPLHLITELSRMSSDRRLINPAKVGDARELGTVSRALYTWDGALGLGLTGGKSWHHIVPEVSSGLGVISDLKTKPDSGGFKFGTRFAFTWGGGIRIVPGGHWQVRGDVKNRLYTIAYPETFYTRPTGGTAVVPTTQARSFWTNNPTFTLGLSYLF
jgi:hypothetical protein